MERTPTIDGVLFPGEWPRETGLRLSRAFRNEHAIHLYFAWDSLFLYLAANVEDADLWADGNGGGAGEYWETWNDDSIEWYLDPDLSRDPKLMPGDRLLALNIGNVANPKNGSGIVSRRSFNRGTGDGGAVGLFTPGVLPSGLVYRTVHYGTVNNPADRDVGYSIEVALPWSALGRAAPRDGELMGMNVVVISDDTGGTRDWSDYRDVVPPALRFTLPVRPDEYVEMKCGYQSGSQSGLWGPIDYLTVQFHRPDDSTPPGPVTEFRVLKRRPYAVKLAWRNPGDNGSHGVCSAIELRYSTRPLTVQNLSSGSLWPIRDSPSPSGQSQQSWVMGLQPGTQYWFAVRARDEAENTGPLSALGPVTLPTLEEAGVLIPPERYRGAVRLAAGGRYFMTEDGANFVPVGHHFLFPDHRTRGLYPTNVWTDSGFINWAEQPGALAAFTNYVAQLSASGVTVMRIFLETFFSPVKEDGAFNADNGAYWLEFPRGRYNPAMALFIRDLLRYCGEHGIYVILSPFETDRWDEYLHRTCWSSQHGGPLTQINDFFLNSDVLAMCKARWAWVIQQVKASGYEDVVMGYEPLNEWDSWEWTRPHPHPDIDAWYRAVFMIQLAQFLRSQDSDRLLLSSNAQTDPRGAIAAVTFYSPWFDAALPHLYFAGCSQPWDNPFSFRATTIVSEQARGIAWWTLNRLNQKPVMDGEWSPKDELMPDPSSPRYFDRFTETEDNLFTRYLWFSELCAGAAGPGLRIQGGVRAYARGLLLSDYMHGVQASLSRFVENGSRSPTFSLVDFPSQNWRGHLKVLATPAAIFVTGCSDGQKGFVYLFQDRNITQMTVTGAWLRVDQLLTAGSVFRAEFWRTTPWQTSPTMVVTGTVSGTSVYFPIPAFTEDWAVRFFIANGASGRPTHGIRMPVQTQGWVWWNVLDGASWTWVNPAGSGYVFSPVEVRASHLREKRWYWLGVWDVGRQDWLHGQWFGFF